MSIIKDEWVRQTLFAAGATILPQCAWYFPESRSGMVLGSLAAALLFMLGARQARNRSFLLCGVFAVLSVCAAKRAEPALEVRRRLSRMPAEEPGWRVRLGAYSPAQAQRRVRAAIACEVQGPVRHPTPGEVAFDCTDTASQAPLKVHLSAPNLPWSSARDISPGERIRAVVELRTAAVMPPVPSSYEGYLFRRGIAASGSIIELTYRSGRPATVSSGAAARLEAAFGSSASSSVLLAGVLGEKDFLGADETLLFRSTGTSHLVVVSGFHVGVVFFAASFLFNRTLGRSKQFLALFAREPAAALCGATAAWLYLRITGPEISILRALVALTIFALAKVLNGVQVPARTFGVTLCMTFLLWPGAFLEAGCQLTFLAVAGLVAGRAVCKALQFDTLGPLRRRIASNLVYCTSSWLFTTPAVLLWFGCFVPLGPLYNLGAIPVFSFVTLLLGGAGIGLYLLCPDVGRPLIELSLFGTEHLLQALRFCERAAAETSFRFLELAPDEAQATAVLVAVIVAAGMYYLNCLYEFEIIGVQKSVPQSMIPAGEIVRLP